MTDSARKGKNGERELARLLRDHLGADVVRNLEQARQGGADLLGIAGWAVEVKRAARPRMAEWWHQARQQADATGQRPALCYRLDRQPWRVVVALRHVATGFGAAPLSMTVETDIETFAALVREHMAGSRPESPASDAETAGLFPGGQGEKIAPGASCAVLEASANEVFGTIPGTTKNPPKRVPRAARANGRLVTKLTEITT